ncbi:hypothetical protein AB8U03_11940 [Clostridium sp. Mt-5]|uniref:Uncharacterized protein n=1 Tax=Clostridium moutaii TaxID=3240932 RepID=A0ABV4BT59_9CLOT
MRSLLPLRFGVLYYLDKVDKACADDVLVGLKSEYGTERQFNKSSINDHLLSMRENGIVKDTDAKLEKDGTLCLYYSINEEGRDLLKKYLPKSWRL